MYVSEDLALVTTAPESGKSHLPAAQIDMILGAALLLDLVAEDRITVIGGGTKAKLRVNSRESTGSMMLDDALGHIAKDTEIRTASALEYTKKHAAENVYGSLEQRGVVRDESRQALGLFPQRRGVGPNGAVVVRRRSWLVQCQKVRNGTVSDREPQADHRP